MKKTDNLLKVQCFLQRKIIMYMKMTFLLALMSMLSVSAKTLSQETKINLQLREATIVEVMDELQEQSGFGFVVQNEELNLEKKYNFSKKGVELREVLGIFFNEDKYSYRIIDNNIIIIKKERPSDSFVNQQSIRVKGMVIDVNGDPLPGVNVYQKSNPQHGVITGVDGSYDIEVESGNVTLVYSFIGFLAQEINVASRSRINVTLLEESLDIGEVVVTALGIKREKKALGYATQTVGTEEMKKAEAPDLASKLSGKVAGLQINTAATIGGSSRVVLRGESTLGLGGDQALIVVDGVPINTGGSYASGIDWGNGFSDFNSNDIESISVLKGAAAAALYGSAAGNGVLLITTKKGSRDKAFSVDYNSSVMFESLLEYPDTYQYEYAVGEGDTRWLYDPITGHYNPAPRDETWSSEKYDPNKLIEWWFSPTENGYRAADTGIDNKGDAKKLPFVSSGKNNYEEFFQIGRAIYNQVAISASGKNVTSRFSVGDMDQKGFQPGTDLKRRNIAASFNSKLSDKVNLDFVFNYVKTTSDNRPRQHWGPFSINYVLSWMMPGVYMNELKDYWQPGLEGEQQINWRTGHNNPYFLAHEVKAGLAKDRFFGNVSLNYQINKQLSFMLRHGDDFTMRTTTDMYPFGANGGAYPRLSRGKSETRLSVTDVLLTYNGTFNDIWNVDVSAGFNRSNSEGNSLNGSTEQLLVPGLYSLNNSAVNPSVSEYFWKSREYSVLSTANIGYKNRIYLAMTARNSWSSTLPVNNNSYFYPSASLSVLLNEILTLSDKVSLLKLRAGAAQVGSATGAHNLVTTMSKDGQYAGYQGFRVSNGLKNPDLKPSLSTSYEFGLESSFYNNRLSYEFTYYKTSTKDQIISIPLPQTSGFTSRVTNAGEIQNQGIEMTLRGSAIRNANWNWDIALNFSANRNEVISLAEGMTEYKLAGYGDSGEEIKAVVGKPVMGVYGYKQVTVQDPTSQYYGEKVFSPGGTPIRKNDIEYLGEANPDFILGVSNKVSYRNLNLNFVLDIRKGGIAYSNATNIMYGGGFNKETAEWRNNGYLGDGVIVNSDGSYRPNDVVIKGNDVKEKLISNWRDISTNNIFSQDFIKLRELSLAYNFPKSLLDNMFIERATVSLVGRNLFVWDEIPNQDADVYNDGIPGYTGGYTYPTARNYGVTLNVSF
ncbi:MAG: SusC/RagA family TonB-linked outer membrane protein [Carboxylicivirga sp.]|jgi:TonB-linked SusC/RagA family outer membrane protein|nr:SusC/RagA family TonB-linked outer membrane protein [Carboxylicivirga sp.]